MIEHRSLFTNFNYNNVYVHILFLHRLLSKSGSHTNYNNSVPSGLLSSSTTLEPSSLLTNIVPPPLPPPQTALHDNHNESTASK